MLSTGDKVIAEATDEDMIWGTGFPIGHEFEKVPSEWAKAGNTNIAGYGLMKAREMIKDFDENNDD